MMHLRGARMDIAKYRECLTTSEWSELCEEWNREYCDYRVAWPNASEAERIDSANRKAERFFQVLISRRLVHIYRGDDEGLDWIEEQSREEELERSES
jgi:hypothetical protein